MTDQLGGCSELGKKKCQLDLGHWKPKHRSQWRDRGGKPYVWDEDVET